MQINELQILILVTQFIWTQLNRFLSFQADFASIRSITWESWALSGWFVPTNKIKSESLLASHMALPPETLWSMGSGGGREKLEGRERQAGSLPEEIGSTEYPEKTKSTQKGLVFGLLPWLLSSIGLSDSCGDC